MLMRPVLIVSQVDVAGTALFHVLLCVLQFRDKMGLRWQISICDQLGSISLRRLCVRSS